MTSHCPNCRSPGYRKVPQSHSIAEDGKEYRSCTGCGTAYRLAESLKRGEWLVSVFVLMLVGLAIVALGVTYYVHGGYILGPSLVVGGILYLWGVWRVLWQALRKPRPSTTVNLINVKGGSPSVRLTEWLQSHRRGATYRTAVENELIRRIGGFVLIGLGGVLFLLGAALVLNHMKPSQLGGPDVDLERVGGPVAFIGGAIATAVGVGLIAFARKLTSPRATMVLARDHRHPILLLRSFTDDEVNLPKPREHNSSTEEAIWFAVRSTGDHHTLEHSIVESLGSLGPVIALGVPGQTIAPSGAARTWFPHNAWKDYVTDLSQWSQRIVLIVGDLARASLSWEVTHLFESVPAERIVLVIPPNVSAEENQRRWKLLNTLLGERLPEYCAGTVACYFPVPDRMVRIAVASVSEVARMDEAKRFKAYEQALANVRRRSQDVPPEYKQGGNFLRIESFEWGKPRSIPCI